MEKILEMEEDFCNIYALYEINNDSENITWEYTDMPSYIEWVGKGSTVPFEKDESGKWIKRETVYPREEQFSCKIEFKEDLIKYLNKYFKELLDKKIINRFILSDTSKPPDV
jgi:hypothetical protein